MWLRKCKSTDKTLHPVDIWRKSYSENMDGFHQDLMSKSDSSHTMMGQKWASHLCNRLDTVTSRIFLIDIFCLADWPSEVTWGSWQYMKYCYLATEACIALSISLHSNSKRFLLGPCILMISGLASPWTYNYKRLTNWQTIILKSSIKISKKVVHLPCQSRSCQ